MVCENCGKLTAFRCKEEITSPLDVESRALSMPDRALKQQINAQNNSRFSASEEPKPMVKSTKISFISTLKRRVEARSPFNFCLSLNKAARKSSLFMQTMISGFAKFVLDVIFFLNRVIRETAPFLLTALLPLLVSLHW